MKQSKFNVLIESDQDKNITILYNTFHDHRLIIENEEVRIQDFFKKIDAQDPLTQEEMEFVPYFKDLGILLKDDEDEKVIFDQWYKEKIQKADDLLHVTLVMTMACNLRCPYCFEKEGLDNKRMMSEETGQSIVAWLCDRLRSSGAKELKVNYFGGEPLMNRKVLYQISNKLKLYCHEKNIDYDAGMITNGVLMTPEVSRNLRKVGLDWVKITLDGAARTHDETRITPGGKGTFEKIFFNLDHCNDDLLPDEKGLQIRLGGNFNDQSFYSFYELIETLAQSKFREYIGPINFKPIQDISIQDKSDKKKCAGACSTKCFDDNTTRKMILLRDALNAAGLEIVDHMNLGPCDFYRGDSFSIGLDGILYTCPADFDIPEHAVGHVNPEKVLAQHRSQDHQWLEVKAWTEECYDCSFLPVCVGGCQAKAYADGYDWNSRVCEKAYFKKMSQALSAEMLEDFYDDEAVEPSLERELDGVGLSLGK